MEFLELEETKGPSAFATTLNNTPNANQTILDILGARFADDRQQDASYNTLDEGLMIESANDQVMSNGT